MRITSKTVLASFMAMASFSSVWATTCPDSIRYANGQYLRSGSTFYYSNGKHAKSGGNLYHSNGQYLKSGGTFYYANGQYFKSGSTLYYPNGEYLRLGGTWYYSNKQHLKSGATFYYSNGNYARLGSTLYRNDGSRTDFPVTLRAEISNRNFYEFRVDKDGEVIVDRLNYFIDDALASASLTDTGDSYAATMSFPTGHAREVVVAKFDPSGELVHCSLQSGDQDHRISISGNAGHADLYVNPGFDPEVVRRKIQEALDSL